MLAWLNASLRRRLTFMALCTTFAALLAASVAMVIYDLKSFQQSWIDDLQTQAEILASVSAPALAFDDAKAARENLALLRIRPQILTGAIYTVAGQRFATYARADLREPEYPAMPERVAYRIDGSRLVVYHPVFDNRERVGTVYLEASYPLQERLENYLLILGAVMLGSLLVAAVVAARLRESLTRPILAVTDVAREVMEKRDFALRAPRTTNDEIGVLVDAFNGMLAEVGQRAAALEDSNRHLEREMSVRREAENALLDADRRKDEFLATLAHELRNPLAPIGTGLDILGMKSDDPEAVLRARAIMGRQLAQMVRLVDDLLDVSRITTGKLAIRKERTSLQAVVGSALETVGPFIETQKHALEVDLPQRDVAIDGDPTRLAQVLSNLLNNAAKYTRPGGHLWLQGREQDGWLTIRVSDDGIGIAAELLPRVFDLFVQADISLERSYAGLGVGLSLAKKLVELHGGTIEARSPGLGRGSEFSIRLPAAAEPALRSGSAPPSNRMEAGRRVLLVDDNVDFATSMAGLLRALGHIVEVSHDGADGLAKAEIFRPEFAILDIGLPGMNGYDLARQMRELPFMRDSVLVAVTGWGQERDRRLAHEAGFNRHFVKPVGLDQIRAILAVR